ncbi:MAG: cytochrome C biogenesis protein CcsB [Dehalococcoidia bacterium]|jgi:cytochrome c-type biogenesis protein|nr:MAG: cytochrome C biogenesis protein CcsB [Dehalococcoidia bacterium]
MEITLLIAFSAGLLAFLSPCVLPLVPVYLASVCGPQVFDPAVRPGHLVILRHTLGFILGFSLVFVAMGAAAGFAGFVLNSSATVRSVGGGLMVLMGLFVLAGLKFPWLNYQRGFHLSPGNITGSLRSLVVGAVFSLAWAPCIVALLGGTLSLALSTGGWWQGSYLLAAFSLGIGLPFVIIGLAFDALSPRIKRLGRYSLRLHAASGLLMIAVGISILAGWLGS